MSEALIAAARWWPDIASGQAILLALLAVVLVVVYAVGKLVIWFCQKVTMGWRQLFRERGL